MNQINLIEITFLLSHSCCNSFPVAFASIILSLSTRCVELCFFFSVTLSFPINVKYKRKCVRFTSAI